MKTTLKIGGGTLALLAPVVLLIINSNEGWHSLPELWPLRLYLINDLLLGVLMLELLVLGFVAFRRLRRGFAGLLIAGAALFGCWIAADLYVLLLGHDSSGPGGIQCLSHRNWYERTVENNELGFWERDLKDYLDGKGSGTVVAVLGDSFTWGQGLPDKQHRFTEILDRELGEGVQILNFGRGGTNTQEQINHLIPEVARIKPDVVLIAYLSNDIHDGIGWTRPEPKQLSKWEHRLMVGSPVWNYLYWMVFEPRQRAAAGDDPFRWLVKSYTDPENFREHQQDIGRLVTEVRNMGARPLAVVLPFPHMWTSADSRTRDQVYSQISATFEANDVPVLVLSDVEDQYPAGKFEVNAMDAHPNQAVHQAIAEKLVPWLRQQLEL